MKKITSLLLATTISLVGCSELNSALNATGNALNKASSVLGTATTPTTQTTLSTVSAPDIETSLYAVKNLKFVFKQDHLRSECLNIEVSGELHNKSSEFIMGSISVPHYDAQGFSSGLTMIDANVNGKEKTRLQESGVLSCFKKGDKFAIDKIQYAFRNAGKKPVVYPK